MASNRIRVLSEVVALDAWHDPFIPATGSSSVYVELCFKNSCVGGDLDEFPFTFRMSLKRAELKISVDDPLRIIRKSIAQGTLDGSVSRVMTMAAKGKIRTGAKATGEIGASGANIDFGINAERTNDLLKDDERVFSSTTPRIVCVGEPCGDGSYKWAMEPAVLDTLCNQPWDKTQERLRVHYDVGRFNPLHPEIKAELTCRFEDIKIDDVLPKEPKFSEQVTSLCRSDSRLKAAKHQLKLLLRDADLEVGAMDNRFATVILGQVVAASEVA